MVHLKQKTAKICTKKIPRVCSISLFSLEESSFWHFSKGGRWGLLIKRPKLSCWLLPLVPTQLPWHVPRGCRNLPGRVLHRNHHEQTILIGFFSSLNYYSFSSWKQIFPWPLYFFQREVEVSSGLCLMCKILSPTDINLTTGLKTRAGHSR